MRPRIVLAVSLAMVTAAHADPKAEGFRKLNGAEIKRAFSGHTFSDEVHFSFRYLASGVIEGASMGKKVSRTWRVEKDALCITDVFGENCYAIWKKGPAVKFATGDDAVVFAEGVLK